MDIMLKFADIFNLKFFKINLNMEKYPQMCYLNKQESHLNFLCFDFLEEYLDSENYSPVQFIYDLQNQNVSLDVLSYLENALREDMGYIGNMFYKFLPYNPEIKYISDIRHTYNFLIEKLEKEIKRNIKNNELFYKITKWGSYYILEIGIINTII